MDQFEKDLSECLTCRKMGRRGTTERQIPFSSSTQGERQRSESSFILYGVPEQNRRKCGISKVTIL